MGPVIVLVLVAVACLTWSAGCAAAASRIAGNWGRRLLVALAVAVPVLVILFFQLVQVGAFLALQGFQAGLVAPPLVTCLAVVIGAVAIPIVGLSARVGGARRAAGWPAGGLFAVSLVAAVSAWRALVFVDNAARAEACGLRAEAARMIAAALPPAPAPDDDAAPLYQRAGAALAADPAVSEPNSPIADPSAVDVGAPEVAAILARHADTLDVVRQAADRPHCRFEHDWSRLGIDMDVSAEGSMRSAARLLAVAARAKAADGDAAAALADVVRIGRMGRHVAEMPLGVAAAIATAIDAMALDVLGVVLSRLRPEDARLLDDQGLAELLADVPLVDRHVVGEEALSLTLFADLAGCGYDEKNTASDASAAPAGEVRAGSQIPGWRWFMMPADLRFVRRTFARLTPLCRSGPEDVAFAECRRLEAETTADLERGRPGLVSAEMVPGCVVLVRFPYLAAARRAAARALVAATRERLATGATPESREALVPGRLPAVPRDPFTADAPLHSRRSDDGWVVWSVGPDGEDDGGPAPPGAEAAAGNDDVGLRMPAGR